MLRCLAAGLARAVDALPKTATGKIRKREIVPPAGPREGHDNDYHTTTG
jgi:acyl-coenzyme A synthetase/AMP-(fatty) acid ligase